MRDLSRVVQEFHSCRFRNVGLSGHVALPRALPSFRTQANKLSGNADRVFVHALNTVKRIPRTGSARPPESDRLRLYGLYKQSMEGDVEGVMQKPEAGDKDGVSEVEKWYYNPGSYTTKVGKSR